MNKKYILNGSDWILTGWMRHQWCYEKAMETSCFSVPVVDKLPATVPGSVQTDLFRAGFIEDWRNETNFRNIEWLEHREWVYTKLFKVDDNSKHCFLHLDGLDFNGFVFLNNTQILAFSSMHLRHCIDVTDIINKKGENELRIVFLQPPEVDGQVGYTSKVNILKSRFNYGWDWCPRLVNIGIFGDVWLECCDDLRITDFYPNTSCVSGKGSVKAEIETECFDNAEFELILELLDGDKIIGKTENVAKLVKGINDVTLDLNDLEVEHWYPNGFGKQPLYNARLTVKDGSGNICLETEKTVGFKELEYVVPKNAPKGCLKYSTKFGEKAVTIRGVNWVPISPFYGDIKEEEYEYFLTRFAEMGCNLIRVWGGALQESETFYRICDKLGLMVWQEFPQSSSGIDNAPNEDPEFIKDLKVVAKEFILRARSHISLTFWCGGNELYMDEAFFPADENSANIGMLAQVVKEYNPEVAFLPASPSHCITDTPHKKDEKDFVYGDCHGSWLYEGVENHYKMIDENSAVLFSEIGTPACARPQKLEQYCKSHVWPPDYSNNYWISRGAWWIYYKELTELFGNFEEFEDKISAYAAAFRYTQAESLRASASSVRTKGEEKAGLIIWMANEPFPNAANTSLLEYDGCPKPSFYEIKKCFSDIYAGLKYDSPVTKGKTTVQVYVCSDKASLVEGVSLTVYNIKGETVNEYSWKDISVDGYLLIDNVNIDVDEEIVLARITVESRPDLTTEYIFTNTENAPFGPLLQAPKAELITASLGNREILIENNSKNIAFFNEVVAEADDGTVAEVYPNNFSLLPGEKQVCKADRNFEKFYVMQMNQA